MTNSEMYNSVSRCLENSHFIVPSGNEWFKQCVDFFMTNNPNCVAKDLSSMVAEQLSLSDFQEIGVSSLPNNLSNCEKKVLNGKYCLQVNTILDVGKSCYSQYNIALKRDTTNTEIGDSKPAPWEPKSHRMLKLVCTDGQQNILAMEYEPLHCLKEPFIPGFKIAVIGPVEYRKGVLLLKSKNVHFIGGEVEHFLIKNAPLNVICRALNKPELENPYMFSNIEVENTAMEGHESSNTNPQRQIKSVNEVDNRSQNTNNNSNFIGNGVITYDDFFDGDDDDLLYLTQVAEIETGITQSNNIVNSTPLQSFNSHQPNTIINKPIVPKHNNSETNRKPIGTVKQTKISDLLGPSTSTASSSSSAMSSKHHNDWSVESNNIPFKQVSGKRLASSPVHAETKRPSVEMNIPEDDWDYIDMDVNVSNPLVKVLKSASIIKNSKIQVKQNEWICSGVVIDGTTKHEVEFSSKVLEQLIGISSTEVLQLKNNPQNCAPLKEKIEKGIKGAYRKLHLFKGQITLTCSIDKNKKPIVTDMST